LVRPSRTLDIARLVPELALLCAQELAAEEA
jgi:hypothetical protein